MQTRQPLRVTMAAVAAIAAIVSTLGMPARADTAPVAITAAYQSADAAAANLDAAGLLAHFAPNAVFYDQAGHVQPLSDVARTTKAGMLSSQSITCTTTPGDILVEKSGVTVTFSQKIELTTVDPKTGVVNTYTMSLIKRDHWIEFSGEWKVNRERILSAYSELNGHEVPVKGE